MKKTILYKAAAVLTMVALALVITVVPKAALADVTAITFSPTSPQTILVGGTVTVSTTLTQTGTTTNPTYTWSASPSGVVSLSSTTASSVTFTGLTAGTATVTVTALDDGDVANSTPGTTETYTIVVSPMTVSPSTSYLAPGSTATLTASDYTGTITGWSSSNTSVATVSSAGVVTAISSGTATITATNTPAGGAPTQTATATVMVPTVTLNPSTQELTAASTTTSLTLTIVNGGTLIPDGTTVNWSSSNSAIGSLSATSSTVSSGAATINFTSSSAGTNGTTTITATVGGYTRTATVTVSTVQYLELVGPTNLDATTRTGTYTVYLRNADGTIYDDDTSTVHWSWSSSYLSITSATLNDSRSDMENGQAQIQLYARYNTTSSGTRLYVWLNSDYDERIYHTIYITGLSSLPQTGQDMTLVYVFSGLGATLLVAAGVWYGIRKKRTAA